MQSRTIHLASATVLTAAAVALTAAPASADRSGPDRTTWCGVATYRVNGFALRTGAEAHWTGGERLSCATARSVIVRWQRTKRAPAGWNCDDLDGPVSGKGFPGKGRYRFAWTICNRFASSQAVIGYDRHGH
jgi:hypothetical protein